MPGTVSTAQWVLRGSLSFGSRNVNADLYIGPINNQIKSLRKEIQSLHELESSCGDLYATADLLLDNVTQGLSVLSGSNCFNSSTGMYSTARLKLGWAESINKDWNISKEKSAIQKLVDEFEMAEEF